MHVFVAYFSELEKYYITVFDNFQLHNLSSDHTIFAQLVYQCCVTYHWCTSHPILYRDLYWSCATFFYLYTSRNYTATAYFKVHISNTKLYVHKIQIIPSNIILYSINIFNLNKKHNYYSTDALTFESVALLVLFAILSLLPGLYRNRKSIKGNLIKSRNCIANCCCKRNVADPTTNESISPRSTHSSTYCHGAKTSKEENNCCQINPDSS